MSPILLPNSETSVLVVAYLDLGTGSFLFQAAIAGFFGALYFFKGKLQQVKAFLRRMKGEKSD